ncbi:type I glyceraldehyde-3-phosphate dehydrogenase [uncultured Nitrospira sp.]|uniref:type I glyceraldehyde-3-phosphate dehydrogenase n=1 Tax=uncultured Nitrospira sp. TaxID=157176 RepID=UPI003140A654
MKKVAINGLGRIGRLVLRQYCENTSKDVEIVAANDLVSPENLAYLLRFDSVHGRTPYPVTVEGNEILMKESRFPIYAEKDPARLPWQELGVDVVLECTGLFTKRDLAAKHVDAGAKRVIISAPSPTADVTIVPGVNDRQFDPARHQIISLASCTTNSLAPPLKVLQDNFGIEYAMVTTVHAYTISQALVDGPAKKLRRGRAAAVSLIPTTTGAAMATIQVLPELNGRMEAIAIRVPVVDGAITDIVVHLRQECSVEKVNEAFKAAANGPLNGILGYSEEELVSADILGDPHSGIIDALSTRVLQGRIAKVLVWYDNEFGYARRLLDVFKRLPL